MFLIIFLIVFLSKISIINTPHHWDETSLYLPCIEEIVKKNFNPFVCGFIGRGPVFSLMLAVLYKIFGQTVWIGHIMNIFFSFLAVYFTYLLGYHLCDEKVGITASLMMFFSPMFFAESGLLILDVPLAAFTVITIYFFLKNRTKLYILSATLMILTKEPGILIIFPIVVYTILTNLKTSKKILLKKIFISILPVITLIIWWLISYKIRGGFVDPGFTSALYKDLNPILSRYNERIWQIFFKDFKIILTIFSTLSLVVIITQKQKNYRKFLLFLPLILLIPLSIFYKNVHIIWSLLFLSYTLIFWFLHKKAEYLFLYLIILVYAIFFAIYSWFLPRYVLPVYSLFFVLGAIGLRKLFKNYNYLQFLIVVLIITLFINNWFDSRSESVGSNLEDNLEYLDFIKVRQMACNYIETYYPDATVLTSWFDLGPSLKKPQYGYVTKPIKVKYIEDRKVNDTIDFDLIYYAPYMNLDEYKKYYNMILLKRFEINNKYVELYRVNSLKI